MAIYRKINTTFWSDPFICDLAPDKKLFYLYILTNERTKQCGIYDISKRQISFDLGISINEVTENINFFNSKGKIMFSENTNEIAVKNWVRFNGSTSPKVVKCVESELLLIKNRVLIDYIYSIDTLSQETQAQTPTEEQEETPIPKEHTKTKNDFIYEILIDSNIWLEQTAMQSKQKLKPDQVKEYLKKYNDMINVQFEIKNNKTEYCTHFINWLNKQEKEVVSVPSSKNRKEF